MKMNDKNRCLKLSIFIIIALSYLTWAVEGSWNRQYFIQNLKKYEKRGYFYGKLETLLPSDLANAIRPFVSMGNDALTGVVHGFSNVDLDLPFFCIMDAPQTAMAAYNLFIDYI